MKTSCIDKAIFCGWIVLKYVPVFIPLTGLKNNLKWVL